jgi:hypothetical protein
MTKLKTLKSYLFLLVLFSAAGYSQQSNTFYKHFTGNLDSNMFISCDLISQNGTVSAWYYYYFENPGSANSFLYGKTTSLSGKINGKDVLLWETYNEASKFKGVFGETFSIKGTWQKKESDKPIPFELVEDYSRGSISLSCYSLQDEHILLNGDNANKNSPKASIDLFVIYPDQVGDKALQSRMDTIITKFLLNKKQSISSPQTLLEDIRNSYFDSYIKSTEGINKESLSAFKWEKITKMDLMYNENHVLSFKFEKFINTGGSSGLKMNKFFVFNTLNNKRIKIDDLIKESSLNLLDELLNKKLRELNGIMPEENLGEVGFFTDFIQHTENFYLNNDGIGFLYNVYEIAPLTSGTTEIFLTFKELKELLKPGHKINWIQ